MIFSETTGLALFTFYYTLRKHTNNCRQPHTNALTSGQPGQSPAFKTNSHWIPMRSWIHRQAKSFNHLMAQWEPSLEKKISHSQMWWLSKRTREQLVVDLLRLKVELYKKTTIANSSGLIRNVCFWNPLDGFMWIPALLHDHWLPVKVVVPELQHRTEDFLKLKADLHLTIWG